MSSGAWFGTSMAPRPSTPTPPFENGSSPNSPGKLPKIAGERMPSGDAFERSSHNGSSHGKSSLEIIKELKASNAKLTETMADMEADFMNQVNEMTQQFAEQERNLVDSIQTKDKQIATMETRVTSTENRIRERDDQLSKIKEDSTFQRHTVADLKNQLYQLQHEIEDAEYDKRDEVDKWTSEKQDMLRELDSVREDLRQAQTMAANTSSAEANDLREELQATEQQLQQSQASSVALEKQLVEKDRAISVLNENIDELNLEMSKVNEMTSTQDQYRQDEAADLRVLNDSLRGSLDHMKSDLDELEKELHVKDETILEQNQNMMKLEKALEETHNSTKETDHLTRQLDDARNEIEELQEELQAVSRQYQQQIHSVEKLEKTLGSTHNSTKETARLTRQLDDARKEIEDLQEELQLVSRQHKQQIHSVEKQVLEVAADRAELQDKLNAAEQGRESAKRDLDAERRQLRQHDDKRNEKRLREIVTKAARERSELEAEFEKRLSNVEQAYQKRIEQLVLNQHDQSEVKSIRSEAKQKDLEIERLRDKLRQAELRNSSVAAKANTIEVSSLKEKIRVLEAKKATTEKTKKQLREAQIALVALDDEKALMQKRLKEELTSFQSQKAELVREHDARVLQMEAEMTQLRDQTTVGDKGVCVDDFIEIERLRAELKEKDTLLEATRKFQSKSLVDLDNGHVDEAVRKELLAAKDAGKKLQVSLVESREEIAQQEDFYREKLKDRDTTISALVKSSVAQEEKLASMKKEISILQSKVRSNRPDTPTQEMEALRRAREAEYVEEVENLRSTVDDYKEVQSRLHHEMASLEKQLSTMEDENRHLREQMTADRSSRGNLMLSDYQEKLQERDAAIATLVKQSITLEEQVSRMKSEKSSSKADNDPAGSGARSKSSPGWSEVRRLQKESEIFAGQIIEQDEEIETLRMALDDRDAHIASLEKDLSSVRRKASTLDRDLNRVEDLQAELDEMQESNNTLRAELREVRKDLREAKSNENHVLDLRAELEQANYTIDQMQAKVGAAARGDSEIRRQLDDALADKDDLEHKLSQQMESLRRSRNASIESLEERLRQREETIDKLKRQDKVSMLEGEIKKLSRELLQKAELVEEKDIAYQAMKKQVEEKEHVDELMRHDGEKIKLQGTVNQLSRQLKELEADKASIDELKEQVQDSNFDREALERSIVDAYERKMSLLTLNKDVTIDTLRKELVEAKAVNSESNEDLEKQVQALERTNNDIRDELEAKLQLKSTKIQALEHTLGAQEQLVENMRTEMDQLQSSMERARLSRRAEIEELQQEIIETSSKAQRQEREITSLKMSLEDKRLTHDTEVQKLRDDMNAMTKETTAEKKEVKAPHKNERLDEIKERYENLKWRNNTLQEENAKLCNRLEKTEEDFDKSRAEIERTSMQLQQEVVQLRQKVRDMEDLRSSAASVPPKAPKVEQGSSRFSRPHRMPSPLTRRPTDAASPRRSQTQASPLRFLKRQKPKAEENIDPSVKGSTDGDSSAADSKMTF